MSTVIETQMLIRKSVNIVFNAFIDPLITTQFWFNESSGYLEAGKTVQWYWHKYQASAEVKVLKIKENELIQIEWGEPKTKVDFIFEKITNMQTYVKIRNYGIPLQDQALINFVIDSTGGFTVLDAAKIYLEHDIIAKLVEDKFPPFVEETTTKA